MLRWITARVEADALKRNKDLAFTRTPLSLVRDEGVAGSNPATPTNFLRQRASCGECYGERNPRAMLTSTARCALRTALAGYASHAPAQRIVSASMI
jgi:hypothetical protein